MNYGSFGSGAASDGLSPPSVGLSPSCQFGDKRLPRHIRDVHGKEGETALARSQRVKALHHQACWAKFKGQLARERASNPLIPLVTDVDVSDFLPPVPEDDAPAAGAADPARGNASSPRESQPSSPRESQPSPPGSHSPPLPHLIAPLPAQIRCAGNGLRALRPTCGGPARSSMRR